MQAYRANTESEEILLAAFKLEFETSNVDRARLLLKRVRCTLSTAFTAAPWSGV